jgi:hypothetical protein
MRESTPAPVRSEAVPAEATPVQTAAAAAQTAKGEAKPIAAEQPAIARIGSAHADAAQPIPYRSDANGLAASTGSALLVAILLLAAFAFALRFAKRRGLLDRWIVAAPARVAGRPDMQVELALRVSPKTTIYRIRDAGRNYLLVESLAQTTLTLLTNEDTSIQNDDEHDDAC